MPETGVHFGFLTQYLGWNLGTGSGVYHILAYSWTSACRTASTCTVDYLITYTDGSNLALIQYEIYTIAEFYASEWTRGPEFSYEIESALKKELSIVFSQSHGCPTLSTLHSSIVRDEAQPETHEGGGEVQGRSLHLLTRYTQPQAAQQV